MAGDDASLTDSEQISSAGVFASETFVFWLKDGSVGATNARALTTARLELSMKTTTKIEGGNKGTNYQPMEKGTFAHLFVKSNMKYLEDMIYQILPLGK